MVDDSKKDFVNLVSVIGEASRAKIIYILITSGRAYTAHELALEANLSTTSASNHLSKLVGNKILQVHKQGRHKYFMIYDTDVAHALEAVLNISGFEVKAPTGEVEELRYCRTCYDHLAGRAGVIITSELERRKYIIREGKDYHLTDIGYSWFENELGISSDILNKKQQRNFARQCLDWSERQIHLSGYLGSLLFKVMLQRNWLQRKEFTRAIFVTNIGKKGIYDLLKIDL